MIFLLCLEFLEQEEEIMDWMGKDFSLFPFLFVSFFSVITKYTPSDHEGFFQNEHRKMDDLIYRAYFNNFSIFSVIMQFLGNKKLL